MSEFIGGLTVNLRKKVFEDCAPWGASFPRILGPSKSAKRNLNLSDSCLNILMAQIALPQLSDSAIGFVRVPLAPQTPPGDKDVVAAAQLVMDLTQKYGTP